MKIISPRFKDYYDFIAGYDEDPRKVYVRNVEQHRIGDFCNSKNIALHIPQDIVIKKNGIAYGSDRKLLFGAVAFCNQWMPFVTDDLKNVYYYTFESVPEDIINKLFKKVQEKWWHSSGLDIVKRHFGIKNKHEYSSTVANISKDKDIRSRLNRLVKSPIIIINKGMVIISGRLEDIHFAKFKTAQEVFTDIYNWIEYPEPKMPDGVHDMQRFEGKGFDKKSSFRNIK